MRHASRTQRSPEERFTRSYVEQPGRADTPCWTWVKCVTQNSGYPTMMVLGKRVNVRRWVYALHNRATLDRKVLILPTCGNPLCVRPIHMRVLTVQRRQRLLADCGLIGGHSVRRGQYRERGRWAKVPA